MNYANQPYRDTHLLCEQNKAWLTKVGVQLAGSREGMDVTARSWSYKMQGNRLAGNVGCDKPIRQVCLKFTMGRCFRGELCKYLHGYHEYATSTSDIVSVSDIPADVKKKANKKNKKKRSKMETSARYEEPMKEEVADPSKQGMQINSWLDTSLSDANTMSLSGVPVEMEISASKNNDLENVLMRDQPIKKKVKRPDTSCEETVVVEVENIMLADKHKIENDQNAQLRNQVTQLLQVEQEQKLQIRERDTTIQNLQDKIEGLEQQLNEALRSAESRSGSVPDSNLKAAEDNVDSSAVLKKLVEEFVMDPSQPQHMRVYARRKVKPRQQQQQFTAAEQITTGKNTNL